MNIQIKNFRPALWSLVLLISLMSACSPVEDSHSEVSAPDSVLISGTAQKGPFDNGSEVLVNWLSPEGVPNENALLGFVYDDLGNFEISTDTFGPVLVSVNGTSLNERTGSSTSGRLTLRGVYEITQNEDARFNVNVLTHLSYRRIQAYMGAGLSFSEATHRAEAEVIRSLQSVFPYSEPNSFPPFIELSLSAPNLNHLEATAYLLVLSTSFMEFAQIQAENSIDSSIESELSEYLSFLAEDLANNGKLTTNLNEDVPRELLGLRTASQNINPDSTLDNLLRRSQLQIDRSTFIAALNSFIDTDGDGQFNISDEDDDGDGITDRLDLTPYKATSAPTILGIENGKTYSSVQAIELTFQSDEPIDNIQLEIAESSTPDNVTQIVVDGAGYALFLVRGSHQLRARSQNSLGAWSPWSEYYTVEVDMFNKHFGKNMFLGKTYIAESGSGGSYALGATSTGERFQGHFIQGPSASYIASIKNDGGLDWVTVLDTSRYDTPIRLLLADDGSAVAVTHKAWEGINTLIVYNIAATGVVISKTEIEPHLLMMTDPAGYSAVFGAVPFLWEGDGFVIAWFSTVYKFALDGSILWEHRVDPYLVRNFVTYEIRSNKKDEYELLGKYDYPASYDISPKGSQPAVVVINRNFQTNLFDEKYHKHVNTLPTGVYKPRTLTFGTGNTLYLITNSSTSSSLYTIRKTSFSGDPIWSANVETDFSLRDWPSEEFIDKLVEKNGLVYYAMNSKDLVNENQIFSLTTLNTDGSVLKTQKYSYASIHNVEEELPLNESGIVTKTARINNFLVDSEGGFLLSSTITEDNIQSLSLIKTDINGHVGAWSALEGF